MKASFEEILVVIPARGGSKRIPFKNIKNIAGQPMIYWPLMELSKIFCKNKILVSTDSLQVKTTVEKTGLRVPFTRPENLSNDIVGTTEVVSHAVSWYERNVGNIKFVLTVYPTAVLLRNSDIRSALNRLVHNPQIDSIMSATTFPSPIQRAFYQNNQGFAQMFKPENFKKRSQDFIEAYQDAGQFYLSRVAGARQGASLIDSNVAIQLLERSQVIDIDYMEDFVIAERLLKSSLINSPLKAWSFD